MTSLDRYGPIVWWAIMAIGGGLIGEHLYGAPIKGAACGLLVGLAMSLMRWTA